MRRSVVALELGRAPVRSFEADAWLTPTPSLLEAWARLTFE